MKKVIGLVAAIAMIALGGTVAADVTLSGPDGAASTHATIQAALDAIGQGEGVYTITLPKGTYEEVLYYKGAATVVLSGDTTAQYGSDVEIAIANNGDILKQTRAGTRQNNRCVFEFEGTGNLILENLTIRNLFTRGSFPGSNTQAETIGFDSSGTLAAYNCAFKSHQDTLRMTGKSWFYKCYIEGDVDFIWMEARGKVALFEECEIYSLYDAGTSTHNTYIGAPRMNFANQLWKGLVIYNSSIDKQDGNELYLARSPWSSGYYSQVAYVGTKAKRKGIFNPNVWQTKPLMAAGIDQTIVGYKIDATTAKAIGVNTKGRTDVLSKDAVSKEFNGRRAILNRYYDIPSLKYRKDTDTYWDVDALAASRGWKISKDKSSALAKGESESVRTDYVFDGRDNAGATLTGFVQEGAHVVGNAGSTISFPVKGKSYVTLYGYKEGAGTIVAGKQGAAAYDVSNGVTTAFKSNDYIVYEGATTVTITATAKSYITRIKVDSDDTLTYIPVKSITVSADNQVTEIAEGRWVQLRVATDPIRSTNNAYVWSVSNPEVASISLSGALTAKHVAEDTTVTVKATACDENAVSGEYTVKIKKADNDSFTLTWFDNPASSVSLEGNSDRPALVTAGKAVPSSANWKYDASKIATVADGGISYLDFTEPIKDRNTVYIDLPITAQEDISLQWLDIAYGSHGTPHIAFWFEINNNGKMVRRLNLDETRETNVTKKSYQTRYDIKKGDTVMVRIKVYGYNGNINPLGVGNAPSLGTITISGKKR